MFCRDSLALSDHKIPDFFKPHHFGPRIWFAVHPPLSVKAFAAVPRL